MDLSNLTIDDLKKLRRKLPGELSRRQNAENAEAVAQLRAQARALGYKLVAAGKKKAKTKAPAMYRHPHNPSLEWSGRGRRPVWVIEWQRNNGGDISALKI